MDIKVCEYCGSMDTSMELLTHEITCFKCKKIGKGKLVDFYDIVNPKDVVKPQRTDPFNLITRNPRTGQSTADRGFTPLTPTPTP